MLQSRARLPMKSFENVEMIRGNDEHVCRILRIKKDDSVQCWESRLQSGEQRSDGGGPQRAVQNKIRGGAREDRRREVGREKGTV